MAPFFKNTIDREELAKHLEGYKAAASNPEYGGDLVDWIWDWLWQQTADGPVFNKHHRWIVMRSPDAPDSSR